MIEAVCKEHLSHIKPIIEKEFHTLYEEDVFTRGFVYSDAKEIIGFILYNLIYDRMELNYIYINPLKRHQGLANELMEAMIQDGINNQVKNITLEVNVGNEVAISLYSKYGFSICATRKGYYNGQDGYLMIRE